MYFEAPPGFDPATDYQAYTEDPRCREWDDLMRTFQQKVPEAKEDEWWPTMELVFDMQLHI